jgi:hypothetical protein
MKIRPVRAELFRAGGEANLIVTFRNFAKAPKNKILTSLGKALCYANAINL